MKKTLILVGVAIVVYIILKIVTYSIENKDVAFCDSLAGSGYSSVEELDVGLGPNGPVKGKWSRRCYSDCDLPPKFSKESHVLSGTK